MTHGRNSRFVGWDSPWIVENKRTLDLKKIKKKKTAHIWSKDTAIALKNTQTFPTTVDTCQTAY